MSDNSPLPTSAARQLVKIAGLGTSAGILVTIAFIMGNWIDQRYALNPWAKLICVVLAFIAIMYHFIITWKKTMSTTTTNL